METERIPPALLSGLTRKAFIFAFLFGFDLRIDLSSHLLHGTETYALLQTNAEECSKSPDV